MNDLIRKFERESYIDVYALGKDRAKWEAALEKFAELIVGECLKLNSKELSITAIERLLPLYREHFGIEE
jgi:hypothetical protein